MRVTSYGAAQTVTGSCHYVEASGFKFIIDCGMFQGSKELNRRNYEPFAFDPAEVDFLILTHGHIDHCGLLPKLTRNGFKGAIYTSPATADLLPAMLMDSAFIQGKGYRAGKPPQRAEGPGTARSAIYEGRCPGCSGCC